MAERHERRRVLLVTHDLEGWGAQRQLVELAKGLDRRRYDVHVASLIEGGPLASELQAAQIPVVYFARRWRWDITPLFRLATWLRSQQIDVVHSFMFLPNFYSRFAACLARTPAVISSLRSASVEVEGRLRFAVDIATCFLCDAMVANSQAGADLYRRHGGLSRRVLVIHNGLPAQPSASQEDCQRAAADWQLQRFQPRIGMVAAFEDRKDQALLIRSLPALLQRHPRAGLVFAGDGSTRAATEALVTSLGLTEHVVFLGRVRAALVYPLLDLYVQSSRSGEGVSNSILEAMQQGLAVVATDTGGNCEVVVDRQTGRVVPPGDVAALSATVAELLDDTTRRTQFGRAGQQRVNESFSIDAMVHATESVYERVLAHQPLNLTPSGSSLPASCSNSAS